MHTPDSTVVGIYFDVSEGTVDRMRICLVSKTADGSIVMGSSDPKGNVSVLLNGLDADQLQAMVTTVSAAA